MSSVFDHERICVNLRILCDSERDWMQCTLELTSVNPQHQLALIVEHPEKLSDLPSHLPRLLLEILTQLRDQLPAGGLREPDAQPF